MDAVQMVIVVASFTDSHAAEAGRQKLAEARITAHILPRVPGWFGRTLGFRARYQVGVHEGDVAKARTVLH